MEISLKQLFIRFTIISQQKVRFIFFTLPNTPQFSKVSLEATSSYEINEAQKFSKFALIKFPLLMCDVNIQNIKKVTS